ncbi:hypothetical protein PVAP13_4NG104300 [Panicum virgatum]|uniref:Uncharacterized protein n=1 Tax=Panicum virgatum TaxID=38727 RepID=A0A8T0TAZ0_PANVG|nr:hypothetical protein PVAP13_4NG104300 [Panicum virgatum]
MALRNRATLLLPSKRCSYYPPIDALASHRCDGLVQREGWRWRPPVTPSRCGEEGAPNPSSPARFSAASSARCHHHTWNVLIAESSQPMTPLVSLAAFLRSSCAHPCRSTTPYRQRGHGCPCTPCAVHCLTTPLVAAKGRRVEMLQRFFFYI